MSDLPAITAELSARLADLDAYIEQRAASRASEKIQAGRRVAQRHVDEARAELRRQTDLADELKRQLQPFERHVDAIRRVIALHKPVTGALHEVPRVCSACRSDNGSGQPYPCPTIRAIKGDPDV